MEQRQFKLEPADLEKLSQIDESITRFSVELAKMVINMRQLESGLESFYESRRQAVNERMKAVGIDPKRVMQLNVVDEEGNCVATLAPEPPAAAPAETPGS